MLRRLVIRDFRNIAACELQFSPSFNFLIGANGSGKTNLLEAIYCLGHGRAFRSAIVSRVIRYEQAKLVVHGRVDDAASPSEHLLPIGIEKSRDGITEVKINGESGQKIVQLAQVLPMQIITPEGFQLLTGGPAPRRAFMDWGVFHLEPLFYPTWVKVKRLMKQRNAQLQTARRYQDMQVWDSALVPLVEQIDAWRQAYLSKITQRAAALCQGFLPEFTLHFGYHRGWDKLRNYSELLAENFARDAQLGYTYNGPHRADLHIKINNIPAESVLSRGQLKLLVCALRLAQGQQLTEDKGTPCIYLIDDFASELDSYRRSLLASELKAMNAQVFISSISAEQVAEMCDENSKMFHVEQGKIAPIIAEDLGKM